MAEFRGSLVEENTLVGLWVRNALVTLETSTLVNNANYGIYLADGILSAHPQNTISGTTTSSPGTGDGIWVGSRGELYLTGPGGRGPGLNRIADNADDEIEIAPGGTVLTGQFPIASNTISKTSGPDEGRHLIENLTDMTVEARYTYWGAPGGPPPFAFVNPSRIIYSPFCTDALCEGIGEDTRMPAAATAEDTALLTRRGHIAASTAAVIEALDQEDYAAAEQLLATALATKGTARPDHVELLLAAAVVEEQRGDYDAARAHVEAAHAAVPSNQEGLRAALAHRLLLPAAWEESASEATAAPTLASVEADTSPAAFALEAYPNPFTGHTSVRFSLAERSEVRVMVYDMLGREVARLAEGVREAGSHRARLSSRGLAAGVYVIQATVESAGGQETAVTRRVTVLR